MDVKDAQRYFVHPKDLSHKSACHERIKKKTLKKDGSVPLITNEEWITRIKKAEERERKRLDEKYTEIYRKGSEADLK